MRTQGENGKRLVAAARWCSRIAFFSLGLLIMTLLLHRLFSMSTPVALNLIKLTMLGGLLALICGAIAVGQIWFHDGVGVPRIVVGSLVSLGILGWPLAKANEFRALPKINDVVTDPKYPVPFVRIRAIRAKDANPADYPSQFAAAQQRAYPDLSPITINRPAREVFDIASAAVRRQNYVIVSEEPPGDTQQKPGLIEAYDRTFLLGFYDDVAIRVVGNGNNSRIDVRSASRYGQHDLGENAARMRRLLREIVVLLEESVPSAQDQIEQRKKKPRRRRSRRNN